MTRRSLPLTLAVAVLAACALPALASAGKSAPRQLYVSLGDSYATGYQPIAPGVGRNTRNGFAYQVPGLARAKGYRFQLVNFGCGGATTESILTRTGCPARARAVGGQVYTGQTQAAAAERFLRRHRGEVGLITVSIGGNDVTSCAVAANPVTCVADAVQGIKTRVRTLVRGLRRAAGRNVPIVGTTYPDVILGLWVTGKQSDQDLAKASVVAFKSLINPTLKSAYQSVAGGRFVDVTAASGAYGSLTQTTTLAPYGVIPVPVAKVCQLTYYCQFRDIHSRTQGYRLIAQLIVRSLRRASAG